MHGIAEAFRPEQVLEIVDLNALSWLRVNRAVLPVMRRRRRGLLVYIQHSRAASLSGGSQPMSLHTQT